jgi:diadenylate cyclase
VTDLLNDIVFLFERLNGSSLLDLFLVTMVFFGILMLIQDTQAMALVRGVFLFYVLLSLFTSMINLPAFSWLIRTTLPGLVLAIPGHGKIGPGRLNLSSSPLKRITPARITTNH